MMMRKKKYHRKGEKLVCKKRDKELDNLLRYIRGLERLAKVTLETQKALFPSQSFERIQKQEIDDPEVLWLQLVVSFDLNNTTKSQLDVPLTPKAFLLRVFDHIKKVTLSDYDVNNILFLFYLKNGQPQYETHSLQQLLAIKVFAPFPIEHFTKIQFKGYRGASRVEIDFTLFDFPFLHPNDWISIFRILSKDEAKYEPIISHLKRMLICYIHEVANMDVQITIVLKKKTVVNPKE